MQFVEKLQIIQCLFRTNTNEVINIAFYNKTNVFNCLILKYKSFILNFIV